MSLECVKKPIQTVMGNNSEDVQQCLYDQVSLSNKVLENDKQQSMYVSYWPACCVGVMQSYAAVMSCHVMSNYKNSINNTAIS